MIRKAFAFWITGLPASGKTTLANELHQYLAEQGIPSVLIDGDDFRKSLGADLGFSLGDRGENIRRAASMARMVIDSGVVAICSFVSPTLAIRQYAKDIISANSFVEIYVNTPLSVCQQRDPKGLYQLAQQGVIKDFTGVSSPYETPKMPDIEYDASGGEHTQAFKAAILDILKKFY